MTGRRNLSPGWKPAPGRGTVHLYATSKRFPVALDELIDGRTRIEYHEGYEDGFDTADWVVTTAALDVPTERFAAQLQALPVCITNARPVKTKVLPEQGQLFEAATQRVSTERSAADWLRGQIAAVTELGGDVHIVIYNPREAKGVRRAEY